MLSAKKVEKLFFIGLFAFWVVVLAVHFFSAIDFRVFSLVSLPGMLLGSIFSLLNFRSWRLFLLGFLGSEVLETQEGSPKLLYLFQAIVLKTLAVLSVAVLILRDDPLDLPGFLLSFSAYLMAGLLLTTVRAASLYKKAIKTIA